MVTDGSAELISKLASKNKWDGKREGHELFLLNLQNECDSATWNAINFGRPTADLILQRDPTLTTRTATFKVCVRTSATKLSL